MPARSARTPAVEIAGVRLSSPDRVLFAEQGLTKRDLADYYAAVAPLMLPHAAGRLLSLVRCPSGRQKACFFQRHASPGLAASVRRVPVAEAERTAEYLAIDDAAGLIALVQIGVLEIHAWGSRIDDIERPDRLILDLDPEVGLGFDRVVAAALEARDRLAGLGLASFVKTTGGKGLHVVVPVTRRLDWEAARAGMRALAEAMAADSPAAYTAAAAKEERRGRIYIDYLRNAHGASAVAPYSSRARAGAPVAMPLDWSDLADLDGPGRFTVATAPAWLARRPADPWAELPRLRQSVTARALRALGLEP